MPWIEQLRSANWSLVSGIALTAYLLGCFTAGYYVVRLRLGCDIRDSGSGSVGARNVGRLLGWQGFLLTLLGDFGKGALAVWLALRCATDEWPVVIGMLAVVAGHVWPAQLRFRGGKGMATSLGALLLYDFQLALVFALLFAAAFAALRKTVLPGLLAMASLPAVSWYLKHDPTEALGVSTLAALVLIAHRANLMNEISRLLDRRNLSPKHGPPEL